MRNEFTKWSPITFLAGTLCFLLTFVSLSCQGTRLASFTGAQLVTGTTLEQKGMFGNEKKAVPPEPWARISVGCGLFAAFLAVGSTRARGLAAAAFGALAAVALLALKTKIDQDVIREGAGLLTAEFREGFWLAFILFGVAAVTAATSARARARSALGAGSDVPASHTPQVSGGLS
jgi:hypothetical protein